MASIGINIYAFSVWDAGGSSMILNKIADDKDIIQIFYEYIKEYMDDYVDDVSKERIYKFVDYEVVQETDKSGSKYVKYLYGRMKTGSYGIETEIVDKRTSKVTHKQNEDEAGVKPFDFLIVLPEDECKETIIVLQTISQLGIKSVLEKGFNQYLREKYDVGYIHFGSIYPREYIERYLNEGSLKRIRLLKYGLPADIAAKYGVTNGYRKTKKETIISNQMGFDNALLDNVSKCIKGLLNYSEVVVVDNDDYEYDDLKIDFTLAGKKKTFSLKNIEKVVISQDITNIVEVQGGNPVKESIINIMYLEAVGYLIEKGLVLEMSSLERTVISLAGRENENIRFVGAIY